MSSSRWKISGDYFEGCNCEVACPCIFGSPATTDRCLALLAWHIVHGEHEGVSLDGLTVALAVETPQVMAQGNWTGILYIDDQASASQREALQKMYTGQSGGPLEKFRWIVTRWLGVVYAPMTYQAEGKRRSLSIDPALDLSLEAISGARPDEEVRIVNDAGEGRQGLTESRVVARALQHRFSDLGMSWDNRGKNAFYARFSYSSP